MRNAKQPSVKVIQDKEVPVPAKVIAAEIVVIADGMRQLNSTRLTRRAIIALIHDNSGLAKGTIEIVLNNLESLEETWLKKKP